MADAVQTRVGRRQSRGFILGSLSIGHGIAHLYDQSFVFILPTISTAMSLSTLQVAALLSLKQGGFGIVSVAGGPFIDMLKRHWGLMLTGCMFWVAVSFAITGASPNFAVLIIAVIFMAIPGALWHLPAVAALSRRFPDRRGFAVSVHGFGSNIGQIPGPIIAGALLGAFLWRNVLFIYAAPTLALAALTWWSLKDLGKEAGPEERRALTDILRDARILVRNPIFLGLMLAAILRGVAITETFQWTPFYLEGDEKDGLGLGHLRAGVYYALLIGAGVASAPIIGILSDRFGRKKTIVPGFILATALSLLVVATGDSFLLPVVLFGLGLLSLAFFYPLMAAILDVAGKGSEATTMGLTFGLMGLFGSVSPFIASVIIDHLGGYGSIYYYAAATTVLSTAIIAIIPLRSIQSRATPTEA